MDFFKKSDVWDRIFGKILVLNPAPPLPVFRDTPSRNPEVHRLNFAEKLAIYATQKYKNAHPIPLLWFPMRRWFCAIPKSLLSKPPILHFSVFREFDVS